MDEWLTLDDMAAEIGKSARTVYRWVEEGKLEVKDEGGIKLFRLVEEAGEIMPAMSRKQLQAENEQLKAEIDTLKETIKAKDRQLAAERERHDTLMLEGIGGLKRQMELVLRALYQQPFWRKLFKRKQLPPPEDELDMEGEK